MVRRHEELGRLILIADKPAPARDTRASRSTTNCVNREFSMVAAHNPISQLRPPAPGRLILDRPER